jgi:hypothetical protein
MTDRGLSALLAGGERETLPLGDGTEFRLLSAFEILEVGREAADMAERDREKALCSNACLLAKVVIRNGVPVFCSGTEVLEKMRVEEIAELSRRWAQFNRRENPSPEDERERVDELKKAWSTRLMSALSGACSAVLGYFLPRRRQRK